MVELKLCPLDLPRRVAKKSSTSESSLVLFWISAESTMIIFSRGDKVLRVPTRRTDDDAAALSLFQVAIGSDSWLPFKLRIGVKIFLISDVERATLRYRAATAPDATENTPSEAQIHESRTSAAATVRSDVCVVISN